MYFQHNKLYIILKLINKKISQNGYIIQFLCNLYFFLTNIF